MQSRTLRSKNVRSRLALLALGLLASQIASAIPVSYRFTGNVTDFAYEGTTFKPSAGQAIFGELTYDAAYSGEYLGGPWPKASALLDWKLFVGDQSFHQVLINPFSQFISSGGQQLTFSDEMPGSTLGDTFFDQGLLNFLFDQDFAGMVPPELPIADFLGGSFAFGGGQGQGNAGATLRGTINMLSVPEPMPFVLMTIGLAAAGIANRRRQRNRI